MNPVSKGRISEVLPSGAAYVVTVTPVVGPDVARFVTDEMLIVMTAPAGLDTPPEKLTLTLGPSPGAEGERYADSGVLDPGEDAENPEPTLKSGGKETCRLKAPGSGFDVVTVT
jgi:hypothetical protein